MNGLKAIFRVELKKIMRKRNAVIFSAVLVGLCLFIIEGMISHKALLENRKTFQEMENLKVQQYVLATQYGAYGIRIMFIPAPLSMLFNNSGHFSELSSNVDVGERLNIYTSFKGRRLFTGPGGFMDYSGILFLCGSILGLLYGLESFNRKEYLMFLHSMSGGKRVRLYTMLSRALLLNLFLLPPAVLPLLIPLANGFNLFTTSFLYLLIPFFLLNSLFLLFGSIAGMVKNKLAGLVGIFAFFLVSVYGVPGIINKIVSINASSITHNYKVELEKLKIIMAFEDKIYKSIGIYKSGKVAPEKIKKWYRSYIDNEYQKILALEEIAKKNLAGKIRENQYLTCFFPITFYFNASADISSRGYGNFLKFYSYNQTIKDGFFRHYIYRKFDAPTTKIESFIKGDENLYFAESVVGGYYWFGIFVMVLYLFCFYGVTAFRFKRMLTALPAKEKTSALDKIGIDMDKGKMYTFNILENNFSAHLLRLFFAGVKESRATISINGQSLPGIEKKDVLYLPAPDTLPGDLTVNGFLTLCGAFLQTKTGDTGQIPAITKLNIPGETRFDQLKRAPKAELLLAVAQLKTRPVIILDDIFKDISIVNSPHFSTTIDELKARGSVIINLSNRQDIFMAPDKLGIIDFDGSHYMETLNKSE